MSNNMSCKQKRRPLSIPPSAVTDIEQYISAGVFQPSIGGADRFCANLTLMKKPSQKQSRFDTLADKNQARVDKFDKPDEEEEEEQLVRLTVDLRLVNVMTLNDSTICLLTFQSIEASLKG